MHSEEVARSMSKTLLLYERAVPITKTRHAQHSVKTSLDFGFARHVNSLPLLAWEFSFAAPEYPIVFASAGELVTPIVLLGLADEQNIFVDAEGNWQSRYIPAFARRYPYVFSSVNQGEKLILCIDEEYQGLNTTDDGERLFTDDGELTNYLNKVVEFQKTFQIAHDLTRLFCKRIMELELLEPMQAQLKHRNGEQKSVGGFMAVSRDKLKTLDDDTLLELNRGGGLELIYLHLQSMQNILNIADRAVA
jgi:hypothetical protein